MMFTALQCSGSPDDFIVTDKDHGAGVTGSLCPDGGELKEVGEYHQMEEERAAFDESVAMTSIRKQGYYHFEAPSVAAVSPNPEMSVCPSVSHVSWWVLRPEAAWALARVGS
jgi:hypothetical protein